MSQEVDQRVVEMRFDNAKFEKNVQQSIDSLNRLDKSLKFEGAEKGFESIENASAKVDFDKMQNALEHLSSKFSALEVIGTTALVKITSKAIDTGEKLVKSLSIDQVTSGWNKYAQKTASVQTIMNATGKSINKVNQYLEKLMWFSDETSYGFTDMTSALSTLTAAGGDIEKMIPMIMGMANATAYAGKGAAEFQRVVYNLAQSYGTGAIQLIDWKSVEQAGADSQQLKQMLIDTAVDLGKIKEGEVTTGTFDITLQKKWADREVMETAFGKYAEFAEAVNAEMKAHPENYDYQASNAIEALADQYDEVTVKAFKAAQEAKSFSEAVDATKDAVSSGWMQTFDILFGNYEEAKTFWSGLAEEFWNIFAGGMGSRNSWLKKAFNGGLDQLVDDTALSDVSDAFRKQLQRSLIASGKLTEEGIADAGSFSKALEDAGVTADDLYEQVQYSLEGYKEAAKMSDKELAAQGVSRDAINKTIEAYQKMADAIQNGEVNLDSYAAKMGQMSGREHFFNGILNILEGINSVLSPIREGFDAVFHTDGGPLYAMLEGFDNLTSHLVLSEGTVEKLSKVFEGFFSVLSVGFKVIKTAGRIALAVLGKLLDALSPLGDAVLQVGAAFGDIFTQLNESLDSAESVEDIINALATAFGKLLQPVKDVWNAIKTLVHGGGVAEAASQMTSFGGIVGGVSKVFENFGLKGVSISSVLGTAVQVLGGVFYLAFDGIGTLIEKAFGGFAGAGKVVEAFKNENLPTLEAVGDTMKSLPEKVGAAMKDFGKSVQTTFYNVADACREGLKAVKEFFALDDVDIYRLLALVDVGLLALAIWGVAKAINTVAGATKKLLENPVTDLLESMKTAVDTWTKQHTANNFVNIAKGIGIAVAALSASMYLLSRIEEPTKALQALGSVMATLFGLVAALKVLAATDLTGLNTAKMLGTVTAISLGMTVLAGAVIKMGSLQTGQIANGVEAIGHIAAVLVGMIGLLSVFNNRLGSMSGAGGFVAAAAVIDMIALALIPLAKAEESGLDIDGAVEAINGVAIAMSILLVASGFAQKLAGSAKENTLDKIIKYLVKLGGMLVAINAMGTALLMAAGAVAIFASLGDRLMTGIRGAGLVLSGMAALLVLLANTKVNPLRMKKAAESMVIASAALLLAASAVKQMGKAMASDTGGAGMAGMSIMLIELSAALYLLGKNAPETTAAAVAMVAMGAALIEMAVAIKMLAEVSPGDIAKGLLAMLGAVAALAIGIGFLSASAAGVVSLAGSCLMLATALLILTPAFKGLATLTAGESLAGVIGIIGMMIGLFAVGAIAPVAQGMIVFSACLVSMGKAFSAFAGGLVKLSIAAGILAVLGYFAGPVCTAINEAGPEIEQALITIVNAICNTIIQCAPNVGLALEALLKTVLQIAVDMIGWLWSGEGGDGEGIQGALEELLENIKAWFAEKFNPANWFEVREGSLLDKIFSFFGGIGEYMSQGLANGLNTGASTQAVDAGAQTLCDRVKEFFKNAFGIHSPSTWMEWLGSFFAPGLTNGLNGAASVAELNTGAGTFVENLKTGLGEKLDAFGDWLFGKGSSAASSFYNGLGLTNVRNGSKDEWFEQWYGKEIDKYRNVNPKGSNPLETLLGDIADPTPDGTDTNPSGSGKTKGKSGSSGKQKTVAEQIEEAYKTKLAANKTLKETVDQEYELWQAENQYSTSNEELTAKKAEHAAAEIAAQAARVELAQQKYDDLVSKWGADKEETKEAYNDLLTEKTSLAEMKAKQYTDIFEDVAKRYDTNIDTMEKEYKLWAAQNDKSATNIDKIDRETQSDIDKLAVRQKKEALAKEQYETLLAQGLAEDNDLVISAYNDWLDAQTETQELLNEIADKQLERIEAEIDLIATAQKLSSSRMDILQKVYDDGDLSERANAYKEAVETYGEDSEQARKAKFQGTTSSILAAVSAAKNLNYQMKQTEQYQKLVDDGYYTDANGKRHNLSQDELDDYNQKLLDSKSAYLGFAENLAEAFDMSDSGKSAMLKLANAVQKNYKYLKAGFTTAMDKAFAGNTDAQKKFMEVFGTAFSDAGVEIGTEVISTITSLMQGDWANALASGVSLMMDIAFNTEIGQEIMKNAVKLAADGFGQISRIAVNAMGDQGVSGAVTDAAETGGEAISGMVGTIGAAMSGSGGVSEALSGIVAMLGEAGGAVVAFIGEFWWVFLILAAIAAVIGGIALWKKKQKDDGDAKDAGETLDKDVADGITDGKDKVDDAVKDMTDGAVDTAKDTLNAVSRVMGDDFTFTPEVSPVLDMTNLTDSEEAIHDAFTADAKAMTLDGAVSRKLAGQIEAQAEIQNGLKANSNADTLNAIHALGEHMDAVGQSIKGMKVVMDGRKTVGYIDTQLGYAAARGH